MIQLFHVQNILLHPWLQRTGRTLYDESILMALYQALSQLFKNTQNTKKTTTPWWGSMSQFPCLLQQTSLIDIVPAMHFIWRYSLSNLSDAVADPVYMFSRIWHPRKRCDCRLPFHRCCEARKASYFQTLTAGHIDWMNQDEDHVRWPVL